MIVTSRLSIDIVRYLDLRNRGVPLRWTLLNEIADHVYGPEDVTFNQAVDLARCRGWIIVEGKSPWRRAGQTKAGCSLVLQQASATLTAARKPSDAVGAEPVTRCGPSQNRTLKRNDGSATDRVARPQFHSR